MTATAINTQHVIVKLKYARNATTAGQVVDAPLTPEPTHSDDELGPFWPLYVDQAGRPLHPVRAAQAIDSGEAELGSTIEAQRHLEALGRAVPTAVSVNPFDRVDAAVFGHERGPSHAFDYADPISAQHRAERRRLVEEIRRIMDIAEDDELTPGYVPPLMRPQQVAKVFGVSEATVYRWSQGHPGEDGRSRSFPTPLRIGGSVFYKTDAILNLLAR
jgi:predicted DNA-binding transcriptional regulator AlpA